jgi:hypothetical protein
MSDGTGAQQAREECGHRCPLFQTQEFANLKSVVLDLQATMPSKVLMERMITAVATSEAHMISINGKLDDLKSLSTKFAAHRQEFLDFKKPRENNGQLGMCNQHGVDIKDVREKFKEHVDVETGKQTILTMIYSSVGVLVGAVLLPLGKAVLKAVWR